METVQLLPKDMILYLLNLIRYDVPILMAGKSSIGKSYTMLELCKQWGMPNSVLYVGSEKADNIEGLPKLIQTDAEASTSESVLEYYKPYWFPKTNLIQDAVQRGQDIFDKQIVPNFSDKRFSDNLPYETIMGLLFAISKMSFQGNSLSQEFDFVDTTKYVYPDNDAFQIVNKPITLTRQLAEKGEDALKYRNELYELSIYLCTLVGLGNYWLLLDELDKVDDSEADKFAPMLHIVRERRLKNYSLRELNDGKGADVAMNVVGNSYRKIYNNIKNNLANNQSVLDSRIIGISNKTDNIVRISDALFKRFIQVIISEILVLKPIDSKLQKIRDCLSIIETKIENVSQGELTLGFLEEINLQWQFGFLPRILNDQDTAGNFIRNNYLTKVSDALMITDTEVRKEKILELRRRTALWKLCVDNFDEETIIKEEDADGSINNTTIPALVMNCLAGQILDIKATEEKEISSNPLDLINEKLAMGLNDKEAAIEVYNVLMEKYNQLPNPQGSEIVDMNSRRLELSSLIDYAFSFISYTAYSDGYSQDKIKNNEPYTPLEINKYLIPLIIKFTLKAITKDTIISFDDKDLLLSQHAKLWDEFSLPDHIAILKGDPDLTNKLFYSGEDSLWGSSDLNADDFQKSFVNSYNVDNQELFEEFIKAYVDMDADERKEFADFIEYIKKYRLDDVKEIKVRQTKNLVLAKKIAESQVLSKKYTEAFGKL